MTRQGERAELLRDLHHRKAPLVLPNAWDVGTARLFERAGFPAIATTSAGMLVAAGYPDGEGIPRRELIEGIRRIAAKVQVPVSADLVAGFGRTGREVVVTVRAALRAGAVGLNLEDLDVARGTLFPLEAQLAKIRAIRELAESVNVPLVLNARTDALRQGVGGPQDRFDEAVRRGLAFRDAGADAIYPMGLTRAPEIRKYVGAVRAPVNVMVRPGLPSVARLAQLGVKRISFGPSAAYASFGLLGRAAEEVRTRGTYRTLVKGAISYDELNALVQD
jgi:2-methylisocitrate lyase-like PEP mutase family enzyme